MIKIDRFIIKENNKFYFDSDSYNEIYSDIPVEDGDVIKYNIEGENYIGKLYEISFKSGLMEIKNIEKIKC